MTVFGYAQIGLFLLVLLLLVKPLGGYMARVFQGERVFLSPVIAPVERLTYRLTGVSPEQEMNWKTYALAFLVFNVLGILFVYVVQLIQTSLPRPIPVPTVTYTRLSTPRAAPQRSSASAAALVAF